MSKKGGLEKDDITLQAVIHDQNDAIMRSSKMYALFSWGELFTRRQLHNIFYATVTAKHALSVCHLVCKEFLFLLENCICVLPLTFPIILWDKARLV